MVEQLSGGTVVIIIAGGVLMLVLLFIFAKRQIMRFALRSRRGPHVPIGHGAKKSLKKEIHRRIDLVPKVVYEPQLNKDNDSKFILPPGSDVPPFYYRLKACDDIKLLEKEITKQDSSLHRHPNDNLRVYLLNTLAAPLNGVGQRLVQQFCDLYEHARHDPSDFGDEEYQMYYRILLKLMDAARLLKPYGGSRKMSPRGTPIRSREKCREMLENKLLEKIEDLDVVPDNNETSV